MESAVNIGASVEAIKEARESFIELVRVSVECRLEQETIRKLFECFNDCVSVNGVTVSGCHFMVNEPLGYNEKKEPNSRQGEDKY